jgi:hypothetical protein
MSLELELQAPEDLESPALSQASAVQAAAVQAAAGAAAFLLSVVADGETLRGKDAVTDRRTLFATGSTSGRKVPRRSSSPCSVF